MTNIEYKVFSPFPFIKHFRDPQGVCFTIIKGSKLAILVDTGYGIGQIRKLVEDNIDTPYIVVNTHGHMDHTNGNFQFDEVYCPEKDIELCINHNSKEMRTKSALNAKKAGLIDDSFDSDDYANKGPGNLIPLKVGEIFDLGDMHVEIINMEGHTKGSVGLLIKEKKLLLSGDAAILAVWMFLRESTDKNTYLNMMNNLKKLDFDNFITGHLMVLYPKRFIDYFIETAMEATPENSVKKVYGGFELDNCYEYEKYFENTRVAFCYQEPKE